MRITENRIIPITDEAVITREVADYDATIMIQPTYHYEFAITPDSNKAELLPINYYNKLITE
jgi:hypothetical protein